MRFICLALALLLGVTPAFAANIPLPAPGVDSTDNGTLDKKNEVPFREDSGLITAEYYLSTGKYAQALTVLAQVLKRHPESADAYTYVGFAYAHLGDLKRATVNYQKALTINPAHLGANRYMAEIYLGRHDLQRAIEQMQVIRLTCAEANCEELDELEAEINNYKAGQREEPEAAAPAKPKDHYN